MTAKCVDETTPRPQSLYVVKNCWLSDLSVIIVILIVLQRLNVLSIAQLRF